MSGSHEQSRSAPDDQGRNTTPPMSVTADRDMTTPVNAVIAGVLAAYATSGSVEVTAIAAAAAIVVVAVCRNR